MKDHFKSVYYEINNMKANLVYCTIVLGVIVTASLVKDNNHDNIKYPLDINAIYCGDKSYKCANIDIDGNGLHESVSSFRNFENNLEEVVLKNNQGTLEFVRPNERKFLGLISGKLL